MERRISNSGASGGFTLIEALVVVAIIALICGIFFANYHQNKSELTLEIAAHTFAQDLRNVQEMAMSAAEIGGQSQSGYGIYINLSQSTTSYKLFADTNHNGKYGGGDDSLTPPLGTVSLESGIYIKDVAEEPISVLYMPPEPSTKITGKTGEVTGDETITLSLTADPSKTRVIHINKSGLIYVN